jgi:DNA-binding NarL/FixJ family response regulator
MTRVEVVVVASLAVGSRLCSGLRHARIPARLADSQQVAALAAAPDGVVLLHTGTSGRSAARVRALLADTPALRVVVLGPSEPGQDLLDALMAGAAGYLPHDFDAEAVARGVRGVFEGEVALPRAWVGRVVAALRVATGTAVGEVAPAS